ncbi:MAG: 4Fe-4S double cluster binding domain-containing protein, partial [Bacillota bacterium]|nr:4Fe-4S double cluster binding domain-containing protein [Bacillota bacterium]
CGACITACPGRIILGDFNIDPRYCRSYLTQKKGLLTDHEIAVIKKTNLVVGCDVCQDVCPHNQGVSITPLDEFRMNLVQRLDCGQLKSLSNKEFMRCWGDRAFSWRGKQILIRNWEYINGRAD